MTIERVAIGEVATVRSGFPFRSHDWLDTGVPVVKIGNVKGGWVALEGCSFVSEEIAREAADAELHPGDVLISMTGHIGEIAKVRNEGRMLLNQRVGRFRIRDSARLNKAFLYYCLQSPDLKAAMRAHAYGAAQPNISPSLIEQQTIPLPSLPAQRQIADILSAYDDVIANCKRRIQILEAMARGLYRDWFIDFRFPGHASIPLVASVYGDIPQGWHVKQLDDVVDDIVDYRGKTPKKLGSDWSNEGILALSALNVKGGRLVNLDKSRRVSEELYSLWMKNPLRQGDILMTSEAPLGELYYLCKEMRFCLSQRLFSIRANPTVIAPVILYRCLESDEMQNELRSRASGATVAGIRQSELRKSRILVPPRPIQALAEAVLSRLEELRMTLAEEIAIARLTRDLLLPRLLSGQVALGAAPTR